ADDVAAADHDRDRAVELDLVLVEERHHADRRRADERRPPEVELARVQRVQAVDVLDRVDRADDTLLVEVVRQRELHEEAVDAVVPVSVVPIEIDHGTYELSDDGAVVERGRVTETVRVPLAHTEGGLTASMTRGALAAAAIRTHVLADRITRASCFVCRDAAE